MDCSGFMHLRPSSMWTKGGGGWPPTPPTINFSGGGHPPTHVPEQVGGTPSPLRPESTPPLPKMMTISNLSFPSWFHTKYRVRPCRKRSRFADKGGRGVIPYPPTTCFFGGGHPPPHVPGQVGGTPSPLCPGSAPRPLVGKNFGMGAGGFERGILNGAVSLPLQQLYFPLHPLMSAIFFYSSQIVFQVKEKSISRTGRM
jgi:hypothetical protein